MLYAIRSVLYAIRSVLYTIRSVLYAIRSVLFEDKIVILYTYVHLVCFDTVQLKILRDRLQHTKNTFSIWIYCQTSWFWITFIIY
jgi:hypothetical protein